MPFKIVKATDTLICKNIGMSPQNIRKSYKNNFTLEKQYHYNCLKIGTLCQANNISENDILELIKQRVSKEDKMIG